MATDYNQVSLLETDDEIGHYCSGVHAEVASLHSDSEYDTDCSLDTEYSFDAPPFSPCRTDEASDVRLNDSELLVAVEHLDEEMCTNTSSWKGFKVVGDNIDKNIRPSFKRYDNKIDSVHYFHYYSLLDCLDLSAYSEVLPTTPLDLSKLLVSTDDVCQLEKDAITLYQGTLQFKHSVLLLLKFYFNLGSWLSMLINISTRPMRSRGIFHPNFQRRCLVNQLW